MNKIQRKEIDQLVRQLEDIKAAFSMIAEDEQAKFDNLNEGLQATDAGQKLEENAQVFTDAESDLDTIIDNINEVIN